MFISKLAKPPYNLRFEGKMTTTNNPGKNALVVTDAPRGSGEGIKLGMMNMSLG